MKNHPRLPAPSAHSLFGRIFRPGTLRAVPRASTGMTRFSRARDLYDPFLLYTVHRPF
ncbi:MAG: hypothetical protein IPJ82_16420 [Lewinellaceae bacterium]|nr:hypothetical protein [Lewinellaceae bacterium]